MQLADITPMILTFNEEANIGRTLEALRWASQILLVDSYSTDKTLQIASEFQNVSIIQREFDHFAEQCNFGLSRIATPWVLSLDADYVCSASLPLELTALEAQLSGYSARFRYCINGKALRGTLYPSRVVLYQTKHARYEVDGHAHRVRVAGKIGSLSSPIDHDDRKPMASWLGAQYRYAKLEADKLLSAEALSWKDRIRMYILLAPWLTVLYCMVWKGLILDGWPGVFYSLQRVYAELLLSLELLDRRLSLGKSTHDRKH